MKQSHAGKVEEGVHQHHDSCSKQREGRWSASQGRCRRDLRSQTVSRQLDDAAILH